MDPSTNSSNLLKTQVLEKCDEGQKAAVPPAVISAKCDKGKKPAVPLSVLPKIRIPVEQEILDVTEKLQCLYISAQSSNNMSTNKGSRKRHCAGPSGQFADTVPFEQSTSAGPSRKSTHGGASGLTTTTRCSINPIYKDLLAERSDEDYLRKTWIENNPTSSWFCGEGSTDLVFPIDFPDYDEPDGMEASGMQFNSKGKELKKK